MSEKDLQNEIAELKAEIKQLKKGKQYGLVWEDKPEDVRKSFMSLLYQNKTEPPSFSSMK